MADLDCIKTINFAEQTRSHGGTENVERVRRNREHRTPALRLQPSQIIRATPAGDSTASELEALLVTAKEQLRTAGSTTQVLATLEAILKIVVARGAWQARQPSVVLNVADIPGYRDFTVAMERALLSHDAKYHQHLSDTWAPGHPSLVTNEAESARQAVLDLIERLHTTKGADQ